MEKQQRLSTSGGSQKEFGFSLSLKLKGVAYDNVLFMPSEEHCAVEKL